MAKITEGMMPYLHYETYYRIVGEKNPKKAPLLLLHGGPGSTHNYFELLDDIADRDQRQIIMYDQLGCGKSFLEGRPELWTKETWVEELIELRKHLNLEEIHLLGQSWGGMLAIIYGSDYAPKGIKSMILSSTLPYNCIWESEQKRRIAYMGKEVQEAFRKAEETGNYEAPEYLSALKLFMERYCAGPFPEDSPECLKRKKIVGTEAYVSAWGPNEFTPTGSLRDYDYMEKLHHFSYPTMIFSGAEDLCSPYIAKLMYDAIPNAEWELFAHSRHMCFVDEPEKYKALLIDWLNRHD